MKSYSLLYRYYYTKFEASKKQYKDELQVLLDMPKKKQMKNKKQINNIQSIIVYLEEHEYFLEQLVKNKDLVHNDKLDNIREDMDNFLMHPGNKALREELKAEYQHMLSDVIQILDKEMIQQQILDNEREAEKESELFPAPDPYPEAENRPKTRKEKREERLRQEKSKEIAFQKGLMKLNKEDEKQGRWIVYILEEEEEVSENNDSE